MNASAQSQRDETLLIQAIADIQGSIHANDNKSSAGLVVQGLLVAAVVTVVTHLGEVYGDGSEWAQVAIKALLFLSLVTALASILAFVRAISPYNPQTIAKRLDERPGVPPRQVFFPDVEKLQEAAKSPGAFDEYAIALEGEVRALRDDPDEAMRVYLAELLKVADIRANEARRAEIGFRFLGIEVALVAAYLAVAGCIAGQILGFAATAGERPTLRWELTGAGLPHRVSSGTRLAVHRGAGVTVRLAASAEGELSQVRLVRRTALRCVRHGRVRNVVAGPPSLQRVNSPGEGIALTVALRAPRRRCPAGLRYAGFSERFTATAEVAGGRRASGRLLLHGPA
jgi:hypothetical protein